LKFRFPAIAAAFRERRVVRQPHPEVTSQDVERIVRRDFPDAQFADVMAMLKEYSSQWEGGTLRVQAAALKLANGNLDSLKMQVTSANRDYRDVIVAAEYPGYWKAKNNVRDFSKALSKKERQQIIGDDWNQYQSWLRK
jgi:hypothetical protein